MITLAGLIESNQRLQIKSPAGEFVLICRPVTEDERTADGGLNSRYWAELDPEQAARWFVARNRGRLACVIGWEGIGLPDGSPAPFSMKALDCLLTVEGVRAAIRDPLDAHFSGRLAAPAVGEPTVSPVDSTPAEPSTPSRT